MADGGADLAQALQAQIADRALQYATPATIPFVQRSAYLADALSNISKTGGQNVRTPGALGSNLLAEALLRFAGGKANASLQGQVAGDQQRVAGMSLAGLPPPDGSTPPISGAPQAPAAQGGLLSRLAGMFGGGPSSAQPTAPPQTAPATAPPTAPPPTGDLLSAMAQNPPGAQPAPSAEPPPQSPQAPPQGPSPTPPQGQPAPPASAPRGIRNNNWGNLTALPQGHQWAGQVGVDQGGYVQFATPQDGVNAAIQNLHSYGALHGINTISGIVSRWAPSAAGNNPQAYAATVAGQLGIDPQQPVNMQDPKVLGSIANAMFNVENGPQAMAQARGGGQGAPQQPQATQGAPQAQGMAQQPPAPTQGAQQPGGYTAPPHGLAPTPDEWSRVQMLLRSGNPALMQQGQAMAAELQKRYLTPPAADQPQWNGQSGQYQAQPGMGGQIIPGLSTPEAQVVYTPGSGKYESVRTPGAIVDNRRFNPTTGGFDPVPGLQTQTVGGFAPGTVVDRDPSGKSTVVQAPQYGAQQIQSVHDNFWGSDETKKAQEAYSAYTGLTGALKGSVGNNGIIDQAAMDSFLRGINPGMGARNSTVQMVADHFGLPQEIIGKIDSLQGKGFITPQILQQMVQTTHDYAVAHQQAAQARATADAKMVAPYGYGPSDLAEDLPPIAPVPKINFGGGAPGPGVQSGNAAPVSHPSGIAGLFPGLAPQGPAGGAPGLPHLTPDQARQAPSGTRFIGSDGVERVRQ